MNRKPLIFEKLKTVVFLPDQTENPIEVEQSNKESVV